MFKKTLEYGKSLQPDKMFILSAKHHLVPLNKELDPYDKTLKEMPKDEKEKWGEETIKQMKSHGLDLNKDKFIFLTGSEYSKPFKEYIPKENLETPMEGRRLVERLKWLNNQINKLNELFNKVKNIIYECLSK
jgi:basic membrane lipoprotein Med (substrate-binding protein (PBP1-ABC) superfamily)